MTDCHHPSEGRARVTLSTHQQLMAPGLCAALHICTSWACVQLCVQLCTIILGPALNISGDRNPPCPGEKVVIIPEITDMVRAALDCATSISCKGCSGKLHWLVTTDAESAGQLTARVLTKSEFAHVPPPLTPLTVSTLWPSNDTFHHRTETGRQTGQARSGSWPYRMLLVMITELNTEHWTHRISFHPICKFN